MSSVVFATDQLLLLDPQVVLKKRTSGDFGVSLRRSAVTEYVKNKPVKKTIYFAEPGVQMS